MRYVTQVCLCVRRGGAFVGNVFKKKGAEPSFCKNETIQNEGNWDHFKIISNINELEKRIK